MAIPTLNQKEAEQFASMLLAGVPAGVAVAYFFDETVPQTVLNETAAAWVKSKAVTNAYTVLQGKNWMSMEPMERIEVALKKHYNDMAFFLMNNNYADLGPKDAQRADKCRDALEKKLAGTAGTEDPLVKLYNDVLAGKYKLPPKQAIPALAES